MTNDAPAARTSKRVLMCRPEYYGLRYEINPWMKIDNAPDASLALKQWNELYKTITEKCGAQAELVPQSENCPDMVFTANAGLTYGKTALLSRFRHPQRQLEEPGYRNWLESAGYEVILPDPNCNFEGEGDALFVGDNLLAGYLKRSDIRAHRWISETLGIPVLSLQLNDDRFYHLDTCLFALDGRTVVYFPDAFDEYARKVIEGNSDTIMVSEEEALRFGCNSVVLGNKIVMPVRCPDLTARLEERGFEVYSVEMSEFLKTGGACKCLTLHLSDQR